MRLGRRLRIALDALIARSSLIPNDPLLDPDLFDWTAMLRANWQAIRDEALAVVRQPDLVPLLDEISPDHQDIAPPGKWRSFFLHGYGFSVPENLARCPRTADLVARIPGLNSAFFSILAPGAHIPAHRGVTKALLTCHLGLIVPEGRLEMAVGPETVRWAPGETILFDDSWTHEVWNETAETRVILLLQVKRPLRAPGKWLADAFLWLIRKSPFVREAKANVELWNASLAKIERSHGLDATA
ncbi:aspartyl/asparaginyl beta-hydroxylase domain-containing protein [Sphingomonas sp. BIUV-7]|uniref:Aspartyl/asparaginyl beta-hydroxylase domain-containing protein n=1 Tax=Sphingomonas natans TaxID=3063330 RepID=A0ABT8YEE8_9SPHN|nr:aspartyl/asparaginyl beta-hydroxylase domain-containing protein [Sphingomonas sp. BIUV-7]MDO6416751.1 aspartyl/asparaginyl beta-hydroxylase domain-containing protein [Sphingomonas sp. BIUV-7]